MTCRTSPRRSAVSSSSARQAPLLARVQGASPATPLGKARPMRRAYAETQRPTAGGCRPSAQTAQTSLKHVGISWI
eukprot:15478513-Alexandrium_andersonii.AAC.1